MYSINPETHRQWHICYQLSFPLVPATRRSINTNSSPRKQKAWTATAVATRRSAGWRGSSPRRGPDDATPRFFRPSSAVFFGKFDTPVCQLFWHVSPLRPPHKRDERRGADTRVPAIYSASRLVNDMRVVQSDIGTGEENKKRGREEERWNRWQKRTERRKSREKRREGRGEGRGEARREKTIQFSD